MAVLQSENIDFGLPNKTTFLDESALIHHLLSLRVDALEKKIFEKTDNLEERLYHVENTMGETGANPILWNDMDFSLDGGFLQVKKKEKTMPDITEQNTRAECEKIVSRAIEFLTDWDESQDIKLQIQYAAIIVGKIEMIKKKEFIQSSEIRKKICTLLRNVIRLNITDEVFTKVQIDLLKKGFQLLISLDTKKEDMLQLNRQFRKEGLMTMPSWE